MPMPIQLFVISFTRCVIMPFTALKQADEANEIPKKSRKSEEDEIDAQLE